MSHILIDFGRILFLSSPVSWCDNVGVFHIVGMSYPHLLYLRGGKRYSLLLFYQETRMINLCRHVYRVK